MDSGLGIKHVLTTSEAKRLGVQELAGKEVDVLLRNEDEKPDNLKGRKAVRVAYYKGRRLGGAIVINRD